MRQLVEDRGRHHRVAEHLAPFGHRAVRRDHHAAALVAPRHHLEEQVLRVPLRAGIPVRLSPAAWAWRRSPAGRRGGPPVRLDERRHDRLRGRERHRVTLADGLAAESPTVVEALADVADRLLHVASVCGRYGRYGAGGSPSVPRGAGTSRSAPRRHRSVGRPTARRRVSGRTANPGARRRSWQTRSPDPGTAPPWSCAGRTATTAGANSPAQRPQAWRRPTESGTRRSHLPLASRRRLEAHRLLHRLTRSRPAHVVPHPAVRAGVAGRPHFVEQPLRRQPRELLQARVDDRLEGIQLVRRRRPRRIARLAGTQVTFQLPRLDPVVDRAPAHAEASRQLRLRHPRFEVVPQSHPGPPNRASLAVPSPLASPTGDSTGNIECAVFSSHQHPASIRRIELGVAVHRRPASHYQSRAVAGLKVTAIVNVSDPDTEPVHQRGCEYSSGSSRRTARIPAVT